MTDVPRNGPEYDASRLTSDGDDQNRFFDRGEGELRNDYRPLLDQFFIELNDTEGKIVDDI